MVPLAVEMQVGPGITMGWQEVWEELRSVMKSNVIKDRRIQPWVIAYLGSGRGKKALKEMKTQAAPLEQRASLAHGALSRGCNVGN